MTIELNNWAKESGPSGCRSLRPQRAIVRSPLGVDPKGRRGSVSHPQNSTRQPGKRLGQV
jgi:hypothetical protein